MIAEIGMFVMLILDFGFWITQILDFGFWILRMRELFGFLGQVERTKQDFGLTNAADYDIE
jgi:hypothetical protein